MRTPRAACLLPVFACLLATASAQGQEARNAHRGAIAQHATVTPAPIAPPHIYKRQDAVPTVTVDDPASIQTGTDGLTVPLPTGNAVTLVKNDDGSVDFLIGPDVKTGVEQAVANSCGSDQGSACQESVQQVLHEGDFGVQSRQVGLLVAAAGIALANLASVMIYYATHEEPVPVRVHLSPPVVSQISSLSSATSVVMTTSGESATTIAVPTETDATPPDGTDSAAVAADIDGSGNLVLNIKEDSVLQWLQNEANNNAQCASSTKVKRQALLCNIFHGQNAIGQMNPGGPLADMLVMPHIPQPNAADILNAAVAIFQAGKTLIGVNALTEDVLWDIAYFLALFYSEPGASNAGATITIPASEINPDAQDPPDDENQGCPTGSGTPACEDDDCQGDVNGARTCTAAAKTSCSCAIIATPVLNTDGDVAWLDAQQTGLNQMFMNLDNGNQAPDDAKPTCDKNTNSGMDPMFVDQLSKKFCEGSNIDFSQDAEKTLGQADLDDPSTDLGGVTITFTWKKGDGTCSKSCTDSYSSLDLSCQFNSHTFTGGGTYAGTCGSYGMQIVEPTSSTPPPSDGPKVVCNSGDAYKLFSRDGALAMMQDICQKLHDNKVVLSESGDSLPPSSMDSDFQKQDDSLSADGSTLVMNPNFAKSGCDDPNNPTDVDFGAMSVDDCVNTWLPAMDSCANFEKGDSDFWKIGGQAQAKCAFWTIYAQ